MVGFMKGGKMEGLGAGPKKRINMLGSCMKKHSESAAVWTRDLSHHLRCTVYRPTSGTLSLGRQVNETLVTTCNTLAKLEPRFVESMLEDPSQISRSYGVLSCLTGFPRISLLENFA